MVSPQIGIGITTHNRKEIYEIVSKIKHFTPQAKVVVVDDASTSPVVNATFRFKQNVGIAMAKNKCLELLQECDYIFLFDDDTHPLTFGWEQHYINAHLSSGQNHFCFTFDKLKNGNKNGNDLIGTYKGLNKYAKACGCMMFITKKVLEKVGGMSSEYNRYGYEHLGWSYRIANAGLNSHPFYDVPNSLQLFRSMDYEQTIITSIGKGTKQQYLAHNLQVYNKEKKEKGWKPY
jgi:GT2 family glycosyltransferase